MSKQKNKKEIWHKGGMAKLRKYGREHYSEMGKKSQEKIRRKYGDDFYKELSRKGVEARRRKKEEREQKEKEKNDPVRQVTDFISGNS